MVHANSRPLLVPVPAAALLFAVDKKVAASVQKIRTSDSFLSEILISSALQAIFFLCSP
ncbi:hypothetical protein KXJ72_01425 [Comamonas aquatica]|nr:hypothetical protein KXJ72_01425 [Comamonas aquatica]